ncbi:cupin domain-containing protein [Lysinibacillus sp. MHQ-1]|nr:cupin domain-containing protein [Lysinibacillus sp. MHQ-1]
MKFETRRKYYDIKTISKRRFKKIVFSIGLIFKSLEKKKRQNIFFYETPNTVGAIWCMRPGQTLPLHSHEKADDIWVVIEGTADYYPECGEMVQIKAGDVVVSRAGEKHGMTNNSSRDFVMLGFAGPTPIGFIAHKHH